LKIGIDDLVSLAISSDVSGHTSGEFDTTPHSRIN
jgi:hypothetical protein